MCDDHVHLAVRCIILYINCPTGGFVNVFLLYTIVIYKNSALFGSHGDSCLGDGHLL